MSYYNQDGSPKYFPNSFNGPVECPEVKPPSFYLNGDVDRHDKIINESDYAQISVFWRRVLPADEKTRIVKNIAGDLKDASLFIIERALKNFRKIDDELASRLIDELRKSGVPINRSGMSSNL